MKNRTISFLFFLMVLLTLLSCRSTAVKALLRPVYVTNSKKINLLPPENVANKCDGIQMFSGTFGENTFSMLSYTIVDENCVSLALMNDFGTDMGSIFYDGKAVSFDSAFFSDKLPGEYIIAELQNVYYDVASLKANYAANHLTFELLPDGSRRILDGKKTIEEIHFTENSITVINYLRAYSFVISN